MINSFTHYLKTTIEFGNGKRFEIKNLIEEKNAKKVLLVCDPTVYKLGIANDIIASVEEAGASAVAFTEVEPDPRVATVDKCGALCKAEKMRPCYRCRRRKLHGYSEGCRNSCHKRG